ncbi:cytochrome c and c1 heme-lyase [Cylindrobasidium torrendii FP15055 ss-10]|uniref:Holocytochrome c-type synthase n=1 Tax=Cylindrobasidium torrendii FP15055 ss-10 TaxID=1314674 RepID=A0A0D7BBB4_9AGAR|nr:cytochrome c and c1 heme-lyase [Cylindrobasidium torrendii FP15055 ss-10]
MSCPVDHGSPATKKEGVCPVDHAAAPPTCPVDHSSASASASTSTSSSIWSKMFSSPSASTSPNSSLSMDRELSTIPRASGEGNWVYPSEAQFFAAMERKNHNPQAPDMKTIVPIHNAVNERAWAEIMKWEEGKGSEKCGGLKLVSFIGRPSEPTPKARWKTLLGYAPPFDRHDWVVDRCGTRTRYVIDFYTGRSHGSSQAVSFYLDVRPALDNWEGAQMRLSRFVSSWIPSFSQSSSGQSSSA